LEPWPDPVAPVGVPAALLGTEDIWGDSTFLPPPPLPTVSDAMEVAVIKKRRKRAKWEILGCIIILIEKVGVASFREVLHYSVASA
jgi:hypothetical protein